MYTPTPLMISAAMKYVDYLRHDCRINLNDYIDEATVIELYRLMQAAHYEVGLAQLDQGDLELAQG
jgi:hypothetical protein